MSLAVKTFPPRFRDGSIFQVIVGFLFFEKVVLNTKLDDLGTVGIR